MQGVYHLHARPHTMIPYTHHAITPEDEAAVLRVLRSGYLTRGPETEALESALCAVSGAKYAVAVSSGTMALEILFMMGRETIHCPAVTFMATASAAARGSVAIKFTDCDSATGLNAALHCTMFVTLGGQPPIRPYAVVDACHGPIQHFGTTATVLSFHPAKHVAAGEGGAILTNTVDLASRCRCIRDAGRMNGVQYRLGTNGHMDEMSAALARSQLRRYDDSVQRRREIAARYDSNFADFAVPHQPESARHLYQLLVDDRDAFRERLRTRGVGTQVHYRPVPSHPYWCISDWRERFPGAAQHGDRTVSIPLYPSMTDEQVETVIRAVKESV